MDKKTHLLYVTKNFMPEIGGGLRRIEALYNIFSSDKNIELTVVTTAKEGQSHGYKNVFFVKQLFFKDRVKQEVTNFDKSGSRIKFFDKALAGWMPNVILKILFKKYDIIFASAPTFTNIVIGFLYKALRFGRPKLVIEYRDFFSFNPSFAEDFQKRALRLFEKIVIRTSDYIIVTTFGMKNILEKFVDKKKIFLARNYISSFDIEKIDSLKKIKLPANFYNIGYVGKLNVGRNPVKVLKLLEQKIKNKKVALHFVGVNGKEIDFIKAEAKKLKLDPKRIFFKTLVPRDESLRLMKSFNGLLILVNSDARIADGYGIPGKLYDYIYTNNNIFSDEDSFENLKDEFKLSMKKKYGEFINFSVNDKETLDNVFKKILSLVLNKK